MAASDGSLHLIFDEEKSLMMVQNALLYETKKKLGNRHLLIDQLKDENAIKKYQNRMREAFIRCCFPQGLPRRKIKSELRGHIRANGITIEKWMLRFDRFLCPAHVYRPNRCCDKIPGIIASLGHYDEGTAHPHHQTLCTNLALCGFTVFTFDPWGQGERSVMPRENQATAPINSVVQHSTMGNLCHLTGENFAFFYTADGLSALDWFCRKEGVRSDAIGATGHSGGGTATAFMMAMDERIAVAAPTQCLSDYETMFEMLKQSGDPDQSVFGLIDKGFDMADFLWMTVPRPILINAATKDFFPIKGNETIFSELSAGYARFCQQNDLALEKVNSAHELNKQAREHIYHWMCKKLYPNDTKRHTHAEVRIEPLERDVLRVSSDTDVFYTPFDALRDRARELITKHKAQKKRLQNLSLNERFLCIRKKVSTWIAEEDVTYHRYEHTKKSDELFGHLADRFLIQANDGVIVACRVIGNENQKGGRAPMAIICDFENSMVHSSWIDYMVSKGIMVAIVEPRGLPFACSLKFDNPARYTKEHELTYHAMINGFDLIGRRTSDVLAAKRMLADLYSIEPGSMLFAGTGQGALIGILAGAGSEPWEWILLADYPLLASYGFFQTDLRLVPSNGIFGMFNHFDWDVPLSVCAKHMYVMDGKDAQNDRVDGPARMKSDLSFTQTMHADLSIIYSKDDKDRKRSIRACTDRFLHRTMRM